MLVRTMALLALVAAAPVALAQHGAEAARAAYKGENWAQLETASRAWISNEPESAEAHRALGIALLKLGRSDEAIGPLRRSVGIEDNSASRFWLGRALSEAGDYAAAEKELRSALAGRPQDPPVMFALATSLAGQGRYREAAEIQGRVVTLAPGHADAAEALAHWKAAARWDFPAEALSRHARARWLFDRGRHWEAIEEYEAALRIAPGFADCHYHMGSAAELLGDTKRAEQEYRAALAGYGPEERMPRGSAEYSLGYLLATRPETAAEGAALIRRAMAPEAHGRKPAIVFALGQACERSGDFDCARGAFLEFVAAPKEGSYPHFPYEKAVEEARAAVVAYGCRPEPGDPPKFSPSRCVKSDAVARFRAGMEHARAERFEQAAAEYQAALRIDERYPACRASLGRALTEQRQWKSAEAVLREALRATPEELGKWRAAALSDLALALVEIGKGGVEAVQLAAEARAAVADLPRQVSCDIVLGRAFAQTGNRPCAVEKLRGATETEGVPDKLRARARELLAELPPLKQGEAERRCFEYEAYRAVTLGSFVAQQRHEHGSSFAEDRFLVHTIEKIRVHARSRDEWRPLSADHSRLLEMIAAHGEPYRQVVSLCRQEIRVRESGRDWWLAIQEPLVGDFRAEVAAGNGVELYVLFAGLMRGEPVFMVSEFRALSQDNR